MKPRGKKAVKNTANNAELKKKFIELEIFQCELGYKNCTGTMMLSFAHSKKRRHFENDHDWLEAVLACTNCHWEIEKLGEEKMGQIVRDVIAQR